MEGGGRPGLFDLDEWYAAISRSGDRLGRLAAVVDFEVFRADLDAALARSDRSKGGRPPMDAVMMFKVLVIQALYGLADEQTEFQVRDRLSFMRFLGLDLHGRVPDARTIWLFRELLTKAKAIEVLFARFGAHLRDLGYLAMGGQMIDASIIAAPLFRETRRGGGGNSYFAMARIDRVEADPTTPGHHYAFLTDFREFVAPVPFARDGRFAEAVLRAPPSASMAGPALRGNSLNLRDRAPGSLTP